jgi:hypothetical protein
MHYDSLSRAYLYNAAGSLPRTGQKQVSVPAPFPCVSPSLSPLSLASSHSQNPNTHHLFITSRSAKPHKDRCGMPVHTGFMETPHGRSDTPLIPLDGGRRFKAYVSAMTPSQFSVQ